MSETVKITQPTARALKDAVLSGCSSRPTQSADFWAVQYQYAAAVSVSPSLTPKEQDAWTAFMQHAYGRYVAAIRASLHPSVAVSFSEAARVADGAEEAVSRKQKGRPLSPRLRKKAKVETELKCQTDGCGRSDTRTLLVCHLCSKTNHAQCLSHPPKFELVRRSSYSCEDCKICSVCSDAQDGQDMVFCDACDRGFHLACHKPALTELPEEDEWYCCDCINCSVCGARCSASEIDKLEFFERGESGILKFCESCFSQRPRPAAADCGSCDAPIDDRSAPFSSTCVNCEAVVHADCLHPGQSFCRACFT